MRSRISKGMKLGTIIGGVFLRKVAIKKKYTFPEVVDTDGNYQDIS